MLWFDSEYCKTKGIGPETVAKPVLDYILQYEGYIPPPREKAQKDSAT
jgi:hypothetical protein